MTFGGGVEIAAHGVHLLGDLPGAAPGRTLEGQMLDEVGKAVLLRIFQDGARPHPYADGYRAQVGKGLRDDPQAVLQGELLDHVKNTS